MTEVKVTYVKFEKKGPKDSPEIESVINEMLSSGWEFKEGIPFGIHGIHLVFFK
ncbi:MAG: hypothetical protein ACFFCS_29055 [Candidatus Hodarchaeota archaeon]